MQFLPYSMICSVMEWYVNNRFDHHDYQLKPKHRFLSQHIMVNDALPNRILSGTVVVKPNIDRFTPNGIIFKGMSNYSKICNRVIIYLINNQIIF